MLQRQLNAESKGPRVPRANQVRGIPQPPTLREESSTAGRCTYLHTYIQGRDHVPISRDAEPLALQRIVAPAALPPHRVDLN